jgi:hypothetical protein
MRKRRLPNPRDVLDEQMPAGKQAHQRQSDHLILTPNDGLDGLLHPRKEVGGHRCLIAYNPFSHLICSLAWSLAGLDRRLEICYV